MRIADGTSCFFTITRIDTDTNGRGDVNAKVSAAGLGFTGANRSVWFDRLAINAFIADLRALDISREGSAILDSMSPGECTLTFSNYDLLGHLQLEVVIARAVFFFGETDHFQSRIRFQVNSDVVAFGNLVNELEAELSV